MATLRNNSLTVNRGANDAVLEAESGLVHETRGHTPLDILLRQSTGLVTELLLEQSNNLGVQLLRSALLGVLGVQVKSLANLSSQPAVLDHLGDESGVAALHAVTKVSVGHELSDVVRHVKSHLV